MRVYFQVFFNTRIKNTGILAYLADLCLTPTRLLFSGKTVQNINNDLAKVSSFFREDRTYETSKEKKFSKQNAHLQQKTGKNLESTNWNRSVLYPIIAILAALGFMPLGIIGSVLKVFSYIHPRARKCAKLVKDKLTPADESIGSAEKPIEESVALDTLNPYEKLQKALQRQLNSGQKFRDLVIYSNHKILNEEHLRLIAQINPEKLILVQEEKAKPWELDKKVAVQDIITSVQNRDKWKKWNLRNLGVKVDEEKPSIPLQTGRYKKLVRHQPSNRAETKITDQEQATLPTYPRYAVFNQSVNKHTVYLLPPKHINPPSL